MLFFKLSESLFSLKRNWIKIIFQLFNMLFQSFILGNNFLSLLYLLRSLSQFKLVALNVGIFDQNILSLSWVVTSLSNLSWWVLSQSWYLLMMNRHQRKTCLLFRIFFFQKRHIIYCPWWIMRHVYLRNRLFIIDQTFASFIFLLSEFFLVIVMHLSVLDLSRLQDENILLIFSLWKSLLGFVPNRSSRTV